MLAALWEAVSNENENTESSPLMLTQNSSSGVIAIHIISIIRKTSWGKAQKQHERKLPILFTELLHGIF